ncbi:MAG: hypothetical protein A2Z96_02630 [Spirochaetes bacterium GWB1_48_6]|nr:MAG: hypothetical protein A2Z96_02630 [Spirochaetes bacterium GWB1_48_6]
MKVQIEFDEKNAQHLMKAVFMYNWVMNATKVGEEMDQSVEVFEQFVLGNLYNGGLQEHIDYNSEDAAYVMKDELEEEYYEDIQAYGGDSFWEDLSDRLAERDLSEAQVPPETKEDFMEEHERLEETYNKEFETHGLQRLRIQK